MPQTHMECFRLLLDYLAWTKHQFLNGIRDSRKAGSLWGTMRGVEGVRKSMQQNWLAKSLGLRLGLLYWGFKGVQVEVPSEEASTHQIGSVPFPLDNAPVHNSILVTDNLTKMGIKTVLQPLYSRDLAPSDFCLFPKLRVCRYETIETIMLLHRMDRHGPLDKHLDQ